MRPVSFLTPTPPHPFINPPTFKPPTSSPSNFSLPFRKPLARLPNEEPQKPSNSNKKDPFSNLDPTTDPRYVEARVCALGAPRSSSATPSLVALRPVGTPESLGEQVGGRVFRMSVTPAQVESIRRGVILGNIGKRMKRENGKSGGDEEGGEDGSVVVDSLLENGSGNGSLGGIMSGNNIGGVTVGGRPGTHCLFKSVLDGVGAIVSKVAVTHVKGDVFYGRVWIRGGALELGKEIAFDARPSDAIALAVRYRASVWLNRTLLREWGIKEDRIRGEVGPGALLNKNGGKGVSSGGSTGVGSTNRWGTSWVDYGDELKSTRSLVGEVKNKPEWLKVARVRARLDLAIRLERFGEAAKLRDELRQVWPVDRLEEELKGAVEEERYLDAAKIRDEIYKFRLAMIESQRESRIKESQREVAEKTDENDSGLQDNSADSKDRRKSSS